MDVAALDCVGLFSRLIKPSLACAADSLLLCAAAESTGAAAAVGVAAASSSSPIRGPAKSSNSSFFFLSSLPTANPSCSRAFWGAIDLGVSEGDATPSSFIGVGLTAAVSAEVAAGFDWPNNASNCSRLSPSAAASTLGLFSSTNSAAFCTVVGSTDSGRLSTCGGCGGG